MPGPCDRLTGSALHAGHCRRLVDQAEPGEHATFEARSSSRAWQCGEVWYGAKRDHRRVSGLAPTGPQTRCCLRSTMAPANCTCAACVQTPLYGPACQTAARQLTCDSNSADSAKSSLKALGRRCPHTQAGRQAAVPYRLPWHSWQCSRLVFVSTQRAGGPHPPPTNCKPPRLGMLFFRQISTSKKSLREHSHVKCHIPVPAELLRVAPVYAGPSSSPPALASSRRRDRCRPRGFFPARKATPASNGPSFDAAESLIALRRQRIGGTTCPLLSSSAAAEVGGRRLAASA